MVSNVCSQKPNIASILVIRVFQKFKLGPEVFLNFFPCVYLRKTGDLIGDNLTLRLLRRTLVLDAWISVELIVHPEMIDNY